MGDDRAQDLLSIDRDVSRGWAALSRWRGWLAQDPESHGEDDPLKPVRRVAGKSMWDALGGLAPSAAEVPHRDALRRWVLVLMLARIGQPDEVSAARLGAEARGHFRGDPPRNVSWREAWRGVVAARAEQECALWMEAAIEVAPALADIGRRRAERRVEVARRLGLNHPWAVLVSVAPGALRQAASRLLESTDDLSRFVWKSELGSDAPMAAVLHAAVARDAGDGWPARLTARWLEDGFGAAARGLTIDMAGLPAAFGASSFARALYRFGFAVGVAAAPPSTPFALAHDPAFVDAHKLGFVLGALPADSEWQARVLGVSARVALAQARVLARTALLEARLHAARLLLGDDAEFAPPHRFEEVAVRLFDGRVPSAFAGAWPRVRDDEPSRFLALLESREFARGVRDRFDSDWYRDPRAWADLRAPQGLRPPRSDEPSVLLARVDALVRAFGEALG